MPGVSGDEMTGTETVPMGRYGNRTHTTKGGGMSAPRTRLRTKHRPRRRGKSYRTLAASGSRPSRPEISPQAAHFNPGGEGTSSPPPRTPQPLRPLTRGKGRRLKMNRREFERFISLVARATRDAAEEERATASRDAAGMVFDFIHVRNDRTPDARHCPCGAEYKNPLLEFCIHCDGGDERESVCGSTLP